MVLQYYIGNVVSNDYQSLSDGIKIIELTFNHLIPVFKDLDGPFDTIESLKNESIIYKELAKNDSRRINQILDPRKFERGSRMIAVKKGESYPIDFIKLFEHTIGGSLKNKSIFGIHYFNEAKMKILDLTVTPQDDSAWEAMIEIERNGKLLKKSQHFFQKTGL